MTPDTDPLETALRHLEAHGLLLLSDPKLESLCSLIAGAPIRGSWWGHSSGEAIYHTANRLADHPDVMLVKLVAGKVTFVHRALWPALVAVGSAREPWQTDGLTPDATLLLNQVDRDGGLRTDALTGSFERSAKSISEAAEMLERRLLVHGEQVHTSSGKHAKFLETWEHWARRAGFGETLPGTGEAKGQLEAVVGALQERAGGRAKLPWGGGAR